MGINKGRSQFAMFTQVFIL